MTRRTIAIITLVLAALVALMPGSALAAGPAPAPALGQRRPDDDADDDADDKDDEDDEDDDKSGKGGKDDDEDDDDDDAGTELERAQRAVAKANKARRAAEKRLRQRESADDKAAGKDKERADRAEARLAELEAKIEEGEKRTLLNAAATKAGFRKPELAFKLAKADGLLEDLDVDDDVGARRIVKDLLKDDPELGKAGRRTSRHRDDDDDDDRDTRRRRSSSRDDDEDDDDDRDTRRRNGKDAPRGVDRLRAHFGEEDKRRRRARK